MSKKTRLIAKCLITILSMTLIITAVSYADEATPLYPGTEEPTEPVCTHIWQKYDEYWETDCIKKVSYLCGLCGATKIEEIDEHEWEEDYRTKSTCIKRGKIYYFCWNCDEVKSKNRPLGNHKWSSYKTIKKASIYRKGIKKSHCIYCKKTRKKTVSKLKPFIRINRKTLKIKIKKSRKLSVKFAYGDKVKSWKSSNKRIAVVNSKGKVTAKGSGKATITVRLKSGKKAYCKITVPAVKKPAPKKSSGGRIVYWVPNGGVWHVSRSCPTLSRSRTIYSGTIAQSGKPRCCKVCG